MKICVITSVYALSDTDRHAAFLVEATRHLVSRGYDVQVFAPAYYGCPSHFVDGVHVHRFRYFPAKWENLTHGAGAPTRIRNPLYLLVAGFYLTSGLISLLRLCRRERFDVLHVHWPFPHGVWGCIVRSVYRVPVVLTFHGAELLLCRRFPFVRFFIRRATACAQAIICNSSFTAAQVGALTAKPVSVVPFGATVEARLVPRDPGKPVKDILFVGRLIERKGVPFLIEALPEVLSRFPARLHIVGEGPMMPVLKDLARRHDVRDSVRFHGVISNDKLEYLYAHADVFVLPSIVDERGDTEGLGVVLIEAMSFGVPVVACEVGGIPDVVISGLTGLLVPQRSAKALAEAIIGILADPQGASRLARGGLEHARQHFNWERITGLCERAYDRATERSIAVEAA